MKNIIKFTALAISLFVMVQCSGNNNAAIPAGSTWDLVSFVTDNQTSVQAPAPELGEDPMSIIFSDSLQLNGYAGCNYYFGTYRIGDNNSLSLEIQGITRKAGPNMMIEGEFVSLFPKVKFYTLKENILTLMDDEKREVMILSARKY